MVLDTRWLSCFDFVVRFSLHEPTSYIYIVPRPTLYINTLLFDIIIVNPERRIFICLTLTTTADNILKTLLFCTTYYNSLDCPAVSLLPLLLITVTGCLSTLSHLIFPFNGKFFLLKLLYLLRNCNSRWFLNNYIWIFFN